LVVGNPPPKDVVSGREERGERATNRGPPGWWLQKGGEEEKLHTKKGGLYVSNPAPAKEKRVRLRLVGTQPPSNKGVPLGEGD